MVFMQILTPMVGSICRRQDCTPKPYIYKVSALRCVEFRWADMMDVLRCLLELDMILQSAKLQLEGGSD